MPDAKRGETGFVLPRLLPGGRRLLFNALGEGEGVFGAHVAWLDRPAERRLLGPGLTRFVPAAGHLLFVRNGTLLAQPFDADRAELTGEPVTIATSVGAWAANAGVGWFAASPRDTLAYFSGQSLTGQVQLAWVDRKGGQVGTIGAPGNYGQIALSPDERNVALEIPDAEGRYDLWVMDVARGVTSRVTATPGDERDPVWSPDGRSLVFIARRDGAADLRRKGLRASEPETVLTDSPDEDIPESWSRDGQTLLFVRRTAEDVKSVWALPLKGEGKPEPVLGEGFRVDESHLSPDGRWLAYVSHESGQNEVYVEPFRREGDRVRVVGGGRRPAEVASRRQGALLHRREQPPAGRRGAGGRRPARGEPPPPALRDPRPPGPGLRRLRAERGRAALPGQAPRSSRTASRSCTSWVLCSPSSRGETGAPTCGGRASERASPRRCSPTGR